MLRILSENGQEVYEREEEPDQAYFRSEIKIPNSLPMTDGCEKADGCVDACGL